MLKLVHSSSFCYRNVLQSNIFCSLLLGEGTWSWSSMWALNETFCAPHCSVPHILNYHIPVTILLSACPQLQVGAEQFLLAPRLHQMTYSICLLLYSPANCSHTAYQVPWYWAAQRALLYVSWVKIIHFTDTFSYAWGNFNMSLTVSHGFSVPDDNLPWPEGLNPAQFS